MSIPPKPAKIARKKPKPPSTEAEEASEGMARAAFQHWCVQLMDWSLTAGESLDDPRLAFVTDSVKADVGSAFDALWHSLSRARSSMGLTYPPDSLGPCPSPLACIGKAGA